MTSPDREALAAAVRAGLGCSRQDDVTDDEEGRAEQYSVCDEHDEEWPCAVAERVVDALLAGPLAPRPVPEGDGQLPTDATPMTAGTGTWRDKVALAEMRDYVTRMTPLVEAIKYEWGPINGGWRLDDDTLSELAWEAAHAVDHWLRQGEGPSHVPMVMFRNEIALREGWRDRALAAGYEPDATWSGEHSDD